MTVCTRISYAPMATADLSWVTTHESDLHACPWSTGNFVDALEAGYSCWVMHDADVPVGYSVVLRVLDEAHLLNISILRTAQGKGMGSRFLDFLLAQARDGGANQFFLEVRPSNLPAIALYAGRGFVEIGRRRGYYRTADGREDAIVMKVEL